MIKNIFYVVVILILEKLTHRKFIVNEYAFQASHYLYILYSDGYVNRERDEDNSVYRYYINSSGVNRIIYYQDITGFNCTDFNRSLDEDKSGLVYSIVINGKYETTTYYSDFYHVVDFVNKYIVENGNDSINDIKVYELREKKLNYKTKIVTTVEVLPE